MKATIVQLCWLLVVLTCLTLAVSIAVAQTSTSDEKPAAKPAQTNIIDENKTLFSWGAVVALLMVAGAATTAMVTSKLHIGNGDLHPGMAVLQDKFESRIDCKQKHDEVRSDFVRVHERFDHLEQRMAEDNKQITSDLSYIRAKLEKG